MVGGESWTHDGTHIVTAFARLEMVKQITMK